MFIGRLKEYLSNHNDVHFFTKIESLPHTLFQGIIFDSMHGKTMVFLRSTTMILGV